MTKQRCSWPGDDPLYLDYHDTEWGVPLYDDQKLFEFLILEGMQAGLSWITILRKRDNFRKAFDNFDPEKVANYKIKKIESLMQNENIIRNKLKINSAVTNAQAFLNIQKEFGDFSSYNWGFVNHKTIQNSWKSLKEIPAFIDISDEYSKDLKKRGFKFVGKTVIYAYMQACGMVNDHITTCFRYKEV